MTITIGPGITLGAGVAITPTSSIVTDGLVLYYDFSDPASGKAKEWVFLSPTNEQITVTSLRKFCRENGLNNGCMSEVATGNRISHKGWRIVSKILYDDTCL
jgi:hypothetical protein